MKRGKTKDKKTNIGKKNNKSNKRNNKKSIAIGIIFFIISNLLLPVVKASALETEIIKNGTFEGGLTYWNKWMSSTSLAITADTAIKEAGLKSVKLSNISGVTARGGINQVVDATGFPGYALVVKQWVKSDKLTGFVRLRAKFMDVNGVDLGNMDVKTIDVSGTAEWNLQQYTINVPNDLRIKKISLEYLYDNSMGTVWIDDISSTKTTQVVTTNLLKNGDVEEGLSYWNLWQERADLNIGTDTLIKKVGAKSLKLSNKTTNAVRGTVGQVIDGTQLIGKVLKMTQWVKSENLAGVAKIRTSFKDSSGVLIGSVDVKSIDIRGTMDWNAQTYYIDVPNDTRIKTVVVEYYYDGCIGTIWLDGITGEKTEKVVTSNLVKNGGFEEGINYWDVWRDKTNLTIETDRVSRMLGAASIKISNNTTTRAKGLLKQTIYLGGDVPTKTLKVSQWVKTYGFNGPGVSVRVRFIDANNQFLEEQENKVLQLSPSEAWKKIEYNVALPEGVAVKAVEFGVAVDNCLGTLWMDELSVVKNNVRVYKNLVQNPGFEGLTNAPVNNWNIYKSSGDQAVSVDKVTIKEGANALKLYSSSNKTNSGMNQYITLPKSFIGKTIKVSQWIKTSAFYNQAYSILIKYSDSAGLEVDRNYKTIDLASNADWTLVQYDVDVPNNGRITALSVNYDLKEWAGTIWFDDMRIEPYTKIIDINPSPSIVSLTVGGSRTLGVSTNPVSVSHSDLNITSLDSTVATIDSSKVIRALKNGVTKVKIVQDYQGKSLEVPVIVGRSSEISASEITYLNVFQNSTLSGKVVAASTVASALQYSLFGDGANGYADVRADGTFTYYPNKDFYGKDSFTVLIKDSKGGMALAQYIVTVGVVEPLPKLEDFVVSMGQGTVSATGKIKVPEQSTLQFSVNKNGVNGVFTIDTAGNYKYTPNAGFYGYDFVEVKELNKAGSYNIIKGTVYVAPSTTLIKQSINNVHPRIMAKKSDFDAVKALLNTDVNITKWFNIFKADTDKILSAPVVGYQKADGLRLVTTSKDYIEQLSFMYNVTGDVRYANRAWLELQNICVNYPNWNDAQFLDVSTMALGAAIGYDWLYGYLSDSQKKIIEDGINNKALNKALAYYANNGHFYITDNMNWNIVCNSGMMIAALAIANGTDGPANVLFQGFKSIQSSLTTYFKDGSGPEGPAYWAFATEYTVDLMASLSTATTLKNQFDSILKLEEMAKFPMYISGNEGILNVSDSKDEWLPGEYSLWFAKKLNKAELTQYHKYYKTMGGMVSAFDFLWYNPTLYNAAATLPLDKYYDNTGLATMRSDFKGETGSFVGFKGGTAGDIHGDLDVGTFVYDALGVRWAMDLGAENYNVLGYWDREIKGDRWNYYLKRAEGHNTLVIGSSRNEDQVVNSKATVINSSLNTTTPSITLDMTPAYGDKALKVTRQMSLLDSRRQLQINDDFVLKQENDVVWQMHTSADVSIVDGGKGVILSKNYEKLSMKLLSTGNMYFQVVDAVPYSTSPNPAGQTKNTGIKKIIVKTRAKSGNIKILLDPLEEQSTLLKNGSFENALDRWTTWKDRGDFNVAIDPVTKKVGVNSVKIFNQVAGTQGTGLLVQTIDAAGLLGNGLSVKQWVKSDNFTGNLRLRAKFIDINGKAVGNMDVKTMDIKATADWNEQQYVINVPNDTRITKITLDYVYDNAIGTIWIDDVRAEKATMLVQKGLILNEGFEEGLSYWNLWKSSTSLNIETDLLTKMVGMKSIKMYNSTTTPVRGGITQNIDATGFAGYALNIKQWVKSSNLTGNVRLRAKFMDTSGVDLGGMDVKTLDLKSNTDWDQQQYVVNVPNDTRIKTIMLEYLYDNCTGTIWIDDAVVTKIAQIITTNVISNGDFEEGLTYWNSWKSTANFKVETDKVVKKSGIKAVKLYTDTATPALGALSRSMDATSLLGRTINMAQWVKNDNIVGKVRLRTSFKDANGAVIGSLDVKTMNVSGTMDWNLQQYTVTVPNDINIKTVNIEYILDSCYGTMWLDDINITKQ